MINKNIQIKLNQLISPQQIKAKHRGSLYTINNSIKRNTLYSITPSKNQQSGYDYKLPQMSLNRKDLTKILQIILNKQQMNLSDRNFLRRILVQVFDQQLIHSGSRNFINHLQLLKYRAYTNILNPQQKLFYFVLRGSVTIKSGGFTYNAKQGNTFGQKQLLSNEIIQQILINQHTLILILNQINFNNYFRYYFQKKYNCIYHQIQCIKQKYLYQIPLINQYYFLDQIKYQIFNPGDKIIQKGKQVHKIYIIGQNWKGQKQSNFIDGCYGLKQILKDKPYYLQSAFCMELGIKIPYVQKDIFIQYIKTYINNNSIFLARNSLKTTCNNIIYNPQQKQQMKKKNMRVRITSKSKKIHTQTIQTIISDFKFFKNKQIQPIKSPKYHQMLFKSIGQSKNQKNSHSIQIKPNKNIIF